MGYSIRTFKGISKELRKLALDNRLGIVLENVLTNDLDEYILLTELSFKSLDICDSNILNNAIVIRQYNNKYTIIFMVKQGKHSEINFNNLNNMVGVNVRSFSSWVNSVKLI